jgi:hypothetical protein
MTKIFSPYCNLATNLEISRVVKGCFTSAVS